MSDANVFQAPLNLSEIYLQHNHLTSVPLHKIVPMPNLRVLDIRDNEFGGFNSEFMKIVKNGTDLRYAGDEKSPRLIDERFCFNRFTIPIGNPLHCDCYVRPLRRWLASLTDIPAAWRDLKCSSPSFVADTPIGEVTEDLMVCGEREIQEDANLDITPDVKYRSLN